MSCAKQQEKQDKGAREVAVVAHEVVGLVVLDEHLHHVACKRAEPLSLYLQCVMAAAWRTRALVPVCVQLCSLFGAQKLTDLNGKDVSAGHGRRREDVCVDVGTYDPCSTP